MKKYCLLLIIFLVSCSPFKEPVSQEVVQEIIDIMATKERAISEDNIDLYVSTLSKENTYFVNEQRRWFKEMTLPLITDLSFEILEIVKEDQDYIATIRQKHLSYTAINYTYDLRFSYEEGHLLDKGLNFIELETDKFTVKYLEGESRVDEYIYYLDASYKRLAQIFSVKPDSDYELKLYQDGELLKQRTVPSIVWKIGGHAEADESLKIYTGTKSESYAVMQHELVHHITKKICNNNISDWLAEGIAGYYGDKDYLIQTQGFVGPFDTDLYKHDIAYLESFDLNGQTEKKVFNWYTTSYLYTRFIVESYGADKLMEIFEVAGDLPFNSSIDNDNYEEDTNHIMTDLLDKVLNTTKEDLSRNYLRWLEDMK